ncbi:MAG: hypothetical protein IT357_06335 [Gemmatimonadaceae bacterium]|nr:hypothetical protein [Gemmatimonadaceae bacterium]
MRLSTAARLAALTIPLGLSAGPGTLSMAVPMSAARSSHTATALGDGRILVAGGFIAAGSPLGAEVYDPATERFTPLPPMRHTRHSHTATLLPDGRVLLAGGYAAGGTTSTVELFDPKSNTFVSAGALVGARADHIAVLLDNGKVLFAGGLGPDWDFLETAELYDPATGRSTATGPMSVERESHVGVKLRDGRVLIVGGHRDRGAAVTLYASAELYDPRSGRFTPTGAMTVRRHKHAGVLLPDGRVLITGGSDERDNRGVYDSSELYDPQRGTFMTGPSMRLGRYKHSGSMVLLADGRVLLGGGAPQAEVYDPRADVFTLVDGAPRMAGQFSAVARTADGGALIVGGYGNGTGPRAEAWRYRP